MGSTDAEHARLVRQAKLFEPLTERLFREAGIIHGMAVLDVGCGMGDVSMLAARLVGPSGRVVGVDQDERVLERARERAHAAGFENLLFLNSDVATLTYSQPFDAAVGRFVLQFLPDQISALRGLHAMVRPGGGLAFQEVS
jgi:ubiquinone/menaquinone biosynthesis C-methylase UbiE